MILTEKRLTCRSNEKELLDVGLNYSHEEYINCQTTLFSISKHLGIFKTTKKILKKFKAINSVVDIGCGGGLFILYLSKYFPKIQFYGIDISEVAIKLAEKNLTSWQAKNHAKNVSFDCKSISKFTFEENSVDVILSTFVCHHLTDDELIQFFANSLFAARKAVIINDLHRNIIPHIFFQIFSKIIYRNHMISHDGLISIRRSFKYHDWLMLVEKANITNYQIKWHFPYYWQVILWKK